MRVGPVDNEPGEGSGGGNSGIARISNCETNEMVMLR